MSAKSIPRKSECLMMWAKKKKKGEKHTCTHTDTPDLCGSASTVDLPAERALAHSNHLRKTLVNKKRRE